MCNLNLSLGMSKGKIDPHLPCSPPHNPPTTGEIPIEDRVCGVSKLAVTCQGQALGTPIPQSVVLMTLRGSKEHCVPHSPPFSALFSVDTYIPLWGH